jgi:hypothetical protein
MSESSNEQKDQSSSDGDAAGISDEQLPEDLQASEDNPLAEPLTEEDAPDDMDDLDMMGGGSSDQSTSESDDSGGADESTDGESASDDDED